MVSAVHISSETGSNSLNDAPSQGDVAETAPTRNVAALTAAVARLESFAGGAKGHKVLTPELAWKVLAVLGIPQNDSAFEMGEDELKAAIPPELHHTAARAFFDIARGLFKTDVDANETPTALHNRAGDSMGAFLLAEQALALHPDNPRYLKYMLICAQHNEKSGLKYLPGHEEERESEIAEELESAALAGSHYLQTTFGYTPGKSAWDWPSRTLSFQERALVGNVARVLDLASDYLDEEDRRAETFLNHARELALLALHGTGLSTSPMLMLEMGPKWIRDQGKNEHVIDQAAWLASTVAGIEYSAGNLCNACIFSILATKIKPGWEEAVQLMREIEVVRPGTAREARSILYSDRR